MQPAQETILADGLHVRVAQYRELRIDVGFTRLIQELAAQYDAGYASPVPGPAANIGSYGFTYLTRTAEFLEASVWGSDAISPSVSGFTGNLRR